MLGIIDFTVLSLIHYNSYTTFSCRATLALVQTEKEEEIIFIWLMNLLYNSELFLVN